MAMTLARFHVALSQNNVTCLYHNTHYRMENQLCHIFKHMSQWKYQMFSYCQILYITLFYFLNSWEGTSISLSKLSAKQGNHWYHFYNVLDWWWNPKPSAPEASTLPIWYRGGGLTLHWDRQTHIETYHRPSVSHMCNVSNKKRRLLPIQTYGTRTHLLSTH